MTRDYDESRDIVHTRASLSMYNNPNVIYMIYSYTIHKTTTARPMSTSTYREHRCSLRVSYCEHVCYTHEHEHHPNLHIYIISIPTHTLFYCVVLGYGYVMLSCTLLSDVLFYASLLSLVGFGASVPRC